MSDNGAMTAAIQSLRAGQCPVCKQTRVGRQIPVGQGFGQPETQKTIFVCGNSVCSNYGKP